MNKIILQAKNKKELEDLIKVNISLQDDETYVIKEIKKPIDFLFLKIKGKYEITILKKDELDRIEKIDEEIEEEVKEEELPVSEKLTSLFTKFVKNAELDVQIESIRVEKNVVVLNITGKDVRYLIGEKGIALNATECLLNSIKEFRGYRIQIDSNNYKEKREETLRNIARKKAEKVLKTKSNCKLSPMLARERKIIHEEISNYENLKTESYGEEPKRFLVIKYREEKED